MRNKNRVTWTEACFREAVKNSKSLSDVCRAIGLQPKGWNFKTVKNYIRLWNLDTSHFGIDWKVICANSRKSRKIIPDKEVFIEDSTMSGKQVKKHFLDTGIENKCNICSISSWHGQDLILHMDHINGINTDNRLENLRLLCPNCHSLTVTYCGRNIKDKREKKKNICLDCSAEIYKDSVRCRQCATLQLAHTIKWPTKEMIIKLIEDHGYLGAARIINCSDNAIRKRLKKLG